MKRLPLLLLLTLLLTACSEISERPLIMFHDDKPDFAQNTGTSGSKAQSRAPLDVPPELREEFELPMADSVATQADEKILPKAYQKAVAGEAVSLDARVYTVDAARVFSAVVDAMTSINIPVESVDSPSGIITSDWIRNGENSSGLMEMFNSGPTVTRHRFISRVYRAVQEEKPVTKLEIRVLGQSFTARKWVNAPMKRKVSEELFSAVEEQLARTRGPEANQ